MAEQKQKSPMDELQTNGVNIKLGDTLFDWLKKKSKERFGLTNQAGMARILIYERWLEEQKGTPQQ